MIKTKPTTPKKTNNPDFDDWHARVLEANKTFRENQWAMIDLLVEGEDRFDKFSQIIDELGFAQQTIANYISIGKRWPADVRRVHIAPSTHSVFSFFEQRDQRVTAISAADTFGWLRDECRDRANAWKAGEKRAFDPSFKPEPRVRGGKSAREQANDLTARGKDDNKPIMDRGSVGQALAAEQGDKRTSFHEEALSDVNQALLDAASVSEKALAYETASFANLERLAAARFRAIGERYIEFAATIDAAHENAFKRQKPAPKAAHAEVGAVKGGGVSGAALPSSPDTKNEAAE